MFFTIQLLKRRREGFEFDRQAGDSNFNLSMLKNIILEKGIRMRYFH